MLDSEKTCIPNWAPFPVTHTNFDSKKVSLKAINPSKFMFDKSEYHDDHEKLINHIVDNIKEEIALNDSIIRSLVEHVLTQAKQHCDEHHKELREKHKNDKR